MDTAIRTYASLATGFSVFAIVGIAVAIAGILAVADRMDRIHDLMRNSPDEDEVADDETDE